MNLTFKAGELRLLLVRHGTTEWNSQLRFLGQYDIPLDEIGQQQVQALAVRLANENIDFIYTSDLKRAFETAMSIHQFHECEMVQVSELREMNFGEWTAKTYKQILKLDPKKISEWETDRMNTVLPGGESLKQFSERVRQNLEFYLEKHTEKTILVVSHGGTLQVLICVALGIPIENYWRFILSPASLSELHVYKGAAMLKLLNDTRHLENSKIYFEGFPGLGFSPNIWEK